MTPVIHILTSMLGPVRITDKDVIKLEKTSSCEPSRRPVYDPIPRPDGTDIVSQTMNTTATLMLLDVL